MKGRIIAVREPQCIYVATRLSPSSELNKSDAVIQYIYNYKQSKKAAAEVWRKGHYYYLPGYDAIIFDELDGDYGRGGLNFYKAGLEWVRRCDAILIYNGLEDSSGVQAEVELAKELNKTIYYSLEEIPYVGNRVN
jgi:hypothetical protein